MVYGSWFMVYGVGFKAKGHIIRTFRKMHWYRVPGDCPRRLLSTILSEFKIEYSVKGLRFRV
jgi:hypothetical protein